MVGIFQASFYLRFEFNLESLIAIVSNAFKRYLRLAQEFAKIVHL